MRAFHLNPTTWLLSTVALIAACNSDGPAPPSDLPPTVASVELSIGSSVLEVGQSTIAIPAALDSVGSPLTGRRAFFASSVPTVAFVDSANGSIVALMPGTTRITVTVGLQTDHRTVTVFKSPIRINEVKPNGDNPSGWVELYNPTNEPVDIGGWTLTSHDVDRPFVFRTGTAIAAKGFLVIDEGVLPLGLGAVDAVHLFSRFGALIDSLSWSANLTPSAGRCTDGAGSFVTNIAPSRGTPNACPEILPAAVR